MAHRVALKIRTPGRNGLEHTAFEVPFYSGHYATLEEAVEVINVLRLTVADKAVTSYTVQWATDKLPRTWHTLEYSDWSELMR